MASMTKHRVKVTKSSGPEGVGNGAFTTSDMSVGTTLLAKGIWYTDMDQLNAWLNQQHPLTGQAMSRNIVEVHFSTPPEGNNITYFFVMTDLAGYASAYPGIIQRPNAQLVFNPDRPLGQHSLQVRLVADLQADREILTAYGSRHGLKDKKRPGPKLNKKSRREALVSERLPEMREEAVKSGHGASMHMVASSGASSGVKRGRCQVSLRTC